MDRIATKEWELTPVFKKNKFKDYFKTLSVEKKKINPVHEIVSVFFKLRRLDKMPKEFYKGRWKYSKIAREAKQLLTDCSENLDDALWSLDKMNYIATKNKFDWSIITCTKYDLIKN